VIEIRKFRRADGVVPFDRWMAKLRDARAKARILVQLDRLRVGLPGDWKAIGGGVFELRIREGKGVPGVLRTRGRDRRRAALRGREVDAERRHGASQVVLARASEASMKASAYKGSDYLKTQKDVVAYLNAALEDGEPAVLLEALRNVAMAKGGMAALARAAGVSRESLYRTLSRRGNPKIETIMELLRALGLKLTVGRRQAA
jgi:probable addiction module antidote protein